MSALRDDSAVWILDDILMIALALVSAILLVVEWTTQLSPAQIQLIDTTDLTIALIFLVEFFTKLILAENKTEYLKWNWWYLLASIPSTYGPFRVLRLLRLLRLIRLVRLVTGTRAILDYLKRFFKKTHIIEVIIIFFVIVGLGSISFDLFEYGVNPAVHGFFDSFWWAMVTVTTIGYGDIYPITVGGRITAMVLMVLGIGTAGAFTALVASFLVKEHGENR